MSYKTDNPTVLALGFFDGVHLGHGALLNKVIQRATELNALPGALSFDTHPSALLSPKPDLLLTTVPERKRILIEEYGMKNVIFEHFDEKMMKMPWQEYLDHLFKDYHAVHLVAGHDHRFGFKGQGTPDLLKEACEKRGIGCDIIPPYIVDGTIVSSTWIRNLLVNGQIEMACSLLGHPYSLTGTVVHGHNLGRKLGFPTVNLNVDKGLLIPAKGVYVTKVTLNNNASYIAITNIGIRPTVDTCDGSLSVESFLLDFDGDLYNSEIRVEFYSFLRPEQKFDSLDELTQTVMHNADQAKEYFRK